MPWGVKKQGNKWAIYKKTTGEIVGHSKSKEDAEASVRARYWGASKKGEKLSEIQNMTDFVGKVVIMHELNETECETMEIDGETYERVPESVRPLSGSIAAAFGYKIRDGKGWVPKGKLEALVNLDKEISEELSENYLLFEFDPNSTANEGRFRIRDPKEFTKDRIWSEDEWRNLKGDGIRFIVGVHKDTGKPELQAVRFAKDKWTENDAGGWIKKSGLKRVSIGEFK